MFHLAFYIFACISEEAIPNMLLLLYIHVHNLYIHSVYLLNVYLLSIPLLCVVCKYVFIHFSENHTNYNICNLKLFLSY